jgi:hypothetical protein
LTSRNLLLAGKAMETHFDQKITNQFESRPY